jgi:hypothetical protein
VSFVKAQPLAPPEYRVLRSFELGLREVESQSGSTYRGEHNRECCPRSTRVVKAVAWQRRDEQLAFAQRYGRIADLKRRSLAQVSRSEVDRGLHQEAGGFA